MKKIALILIGLSLAACSDAPTAEKILRQAGYTEIQTTGYDFFSCGKDDTFSTGFRAKGPTGLPVRGVVCSGWFKGGTIRLF